MLKHLLFSTSLMVSASTLTMQAICFEADFATADNARTMLERAVALVKIDRARAIEAFNHNQKPFRDRDLFVFCFNGVDGKFTAHEAFVTHDVRRLHDPNGKAFGAEMYSNAREGEITEVLFSSPVPGSVGLATKLAYITRSGDQVCGVSAYDFSERSPTMR